MAKRTVIEYQCDRCPAKWHEEPPEGAGNQVSLMLTFSVPGEPEVQATFETLCIRCASACSTYVSQIIKKRRVAEEDACDPPEEAELEAKKKGA